MGDGRLGAQSDFVNCARDPVPVITRDPEYAQIADGYEDGGQRQAQNRISCPVKRRRPRIVAEIWRAAAQPWTVSAATTTFNALILRYPSVMLFCFFYGNA